MDSPGERLKWARIAAGYDTAAKAAKAANVKETTYRAHENTQNGLKPDLAAKYARLYRTSAEWLLYGKGNPPQALELTYHPDNDDDPPNRDLPMTIGTVTGAQGIPLDATPQLDSRAGLGAGGATLIEDGVQTKGGLTFAAEFVADYWRLPAEVLSPLRALRTPHHLTALPVQGNSMAPILVEGDFVFIDTRHRVPSPDGIYALLDEYGGLIVKMLRAADRAPDDDGPWIDVVSKNADYPVKQRRASDLNIVGRVVRRFTADFGND